MWFADGSRCLQVLSGWTLFAGRLHLSSQKEKQVYNEQEENLWR